MASLAALRYLKNSHIRNEVAGLKFVGTLSDGTGVFSNLPVADDQPDPTQIRFQNGAVARCYPEHWVDVTQVRGCDGRWIVLAWYEGGLGTTFGTQIWA